MRRRLEAMEAAQRALESAARQMDLAVWFEQTNEPATAARYLEAAYRHAFAAELLARTALRNERAE